MKKWFLMSLMLGALPLSMLAQNDDMYFVPSKSAVDKARAARASRGTYYVGSNRSVDEYNRQGSYYQALPPDSDIIDFSAVQGVYPDSTSDYDLTRRMMRYEEYEPNSSFWEGYNAGRRDSWYGYGWTSPWYSSYYYGWYDPFYYPWYGTWYDPWYYGYYSPYNYRYGYYGWGHPYYYGYYGGGGGYTRNYPGTRNHGDVARSGSYGIRTGSSTSYSSGTFGGSRVSSNRGRTSSSSSTRTGSINRSGSTYSNSYGNFGGSSTSSGGGTRSSGSSYSGSSSGGGGSFGGSSSGGGGGSSRSGGGSFGGRR